MPSEPLFDGVKKFYIANDISALAFDCKHKISCQGQALSFVEAQEPLLGRRYGDRPGVVPKILFISIDPGSSDPDPSLRTMEVARAYDENTYDVAQLPKNKHWYLTHELALILLGPFQESLSINSVHDHFAHTRAAKCCMNNAQNSMASWRLFENCREYLPGEIEAFRPDVIVTQGNPGKVAIERIFEPKIFGEPKYCQYGLLKVRGEQTLWFHTYHPRQGRFHWQRSDCYSLWVNVLTRFMRGEIRSDSP